MPKAPATYQRYFLFCAISVVYSTTRIIIFKGFDGTDDLHYSMLASRMLKGTYSPFASNDIFSGRVLLIAWQAFIYRVGGISVFTTQAPAIFAVLLTCYLTIFKLLRAHTVNLIFIATSFFYFNPVLTNATKGMLPDIYVVLTGVAVIILWNKSLQETNAKKNILYGLYIGLIIAACMFFKETILLFFLLIAVLTFVQRSRQAVVTCMAMMGALLVCASIAAAWYYHFTGDVFFRLTQIQNSNYYNPCSYDILPPSYIIERLTYGPWKEFISYGFYPVVFSAAFILHGVFRYKPSSLFKDRYLQYFTILLIAAFYFPFSLKGYQPLCGDVRHFLFLLPFGVCAVSGYIITDIENSRTAKWAAISFIIFTLCIIASPDKWQWMEWGLFAVYFIAQKFIKPQSFSFAKIFGLAVLLWLCMPYYLFYRNSNWFEDMQALDKKITATHYYFADHDNMMHWKLLHEFNDSVHCYNLDASPFKIFELYYERVDSTAFQPGWFLVNTKYSERSDGFFNTIDSLQRAQYFSTSIPAGDMKALYIQQPSQLTFVQHVVENDVKVMR